MAMITREGVTLASRRHDDDRLGLVPDRVIQRSVTSILRPSSSPRCAGLAAPLCCNRTGLSGSGSD